MRPLGRARGGGQRCQPLTAHARLLGAVLVWSALSWLGRAGRSRSTPRNSVECPRLGEQGTGGRCGTHRIAASGFDETGLAYDVMVRPDRQRASFVSRPPPGSAFLWEATIPAERWTRRSTRSVTTRHEIPMSVDLGADDKLGL